MKGSVHCGRGGGGRGRGGRGRERERGGGGENEERGRGGEGKVGEGNSGGEERGEGGLCEKPAYAPQPLFFHNPESTPAILLTTINSFATSLLDATCQNMHRKGF